MNVVSSSLVRAQISSGCASGAARRLPIRALPVGRAQKCPLTIASPLRCNKTCQVSWPATVPGAVVSYSKNGKVAWTKAFGVADLQTRTPMQPDLVFNHRSNGKVMTA
jgi:CubicO group peptidase (beta-lactamase class C family)